MKRFKIYLRKLYMQRLVRKLVRLTSEAYDVDKSIQASDLPDAVKERSNAVLFTFVGYCNSCGHKIK